jgi:mannan endo-1,4-beta-mannosidase
MKMKNLNIIIIVLISLLSIHSAFGDTYVVSGLITGDEVVLNSMFNLGIGYDEDIEIPGSEYSAVFYYEAQSREFHFGTTEMPGGLIARGFDFAIDLPTLDRLTINRNGNEIYEYTVSLNAPEITNLEVNIGNDIVVTWDAYDQDGDNITYEIYGAVNGGEWTLLSLQDGKEYIMNEGSLAQGEAQIKVRATDGFNIVEEISEIFSIGNEAPIVEITSPLQNSIFVAGSPVLFEGFVYDRDMENINQVWNSDVDGYLGNTTLISVNLSLGTHKITFTANDGELSSEDSINITITEETRPDLSIDSVELSPSNLKAGQNITVKVSINNVISDVFFNYKLYDGDPSNYGILLEESTASVEANENLELNIQIYEITPGQHNLNFMIYDASPNESNISNNVMSKGFYIPHPDWCNKTDIDRNGRTDLSDFAKFRGAFGTNDSSADFDGNGIVDVTDYALLKKFFGSLCVGNIVQAAPLPQSVTSDFVTVNGTNFYLDGKPFYFAGANSYFLWYEPSTIQEIMNDADSLGITVIRTWGFGEDLAHNPFQSAPRQYEDSAFEAFDEVIAEAALRNIKLIVPLVNNWDDFGGMCQYVRWCDLPNSSACTPNGMQTEVHDMFYTNSCTKDLYKDYVEQFLNRTNSITQIKYRDDPTILAWELANEPRARSDTSTVTLNNWIGEMSAYIKSLDSNHLVTPGGDGGYKNKGADIWNWWYYGKEGQDFIGNHEWTDIDFATFRYYPEPGKFQGVNVNTWIQEHVEDAHNVLGKPVIMEEFGSLIDKVATIGNYYTQLENNGANGDTIWMLSTGALGDGYSVRCPEDTAMCNLIASHANNMNEFNVDCVVDADCNHLNSSYCGGTTIKQDNGVCVANQCEVETIDIYDCLDDSYCNGEETCSDAVCVAGTLVDCSANNISSIGTCNNNPDNNPFTWDYYSGFESICDENTDSCTTGTTNITNTCNTLECSAECATDNDCDDSNPSTADTCLDCSCNYESTENCIEPYSGMNISEDTTLCSGTYVLSEKINITDSSVTLECSNTTLKSNGAVNGIFISAYNVTIKNCQIEGYHDCVHSAGNSRLSMTGNKFSSCSNFAIYFKDAHNSIISNNSFVNSTVKFHNTDRSIVEDNTFVSDSKKAFELHKADRNIFRRNNIDGDGFYAVDDTHYNLYENNYIANGDMAFHFSHGGWHSVFRDNIIENNNLGYYHHDLHYGILRNVSFIGNKFRNNGYAIYPGLSIGVNINENLIINNVNGIFLSPRSSEVVVYRNNIMNSSLYQANDTNGTNSWDWNGQGNYWSDYDEFDEGCSDVDDNGICDAAYTFSNGVVDNYPFAIRNSWLTNPCNIADVDGDGAVNVVDYHELTSTFGMPNYCGPVDFNLDGTVNLQDFVIMRANFGNTTGRCVKEKRVCPVAAPAAPNASEDNSSSENTSILPAAAAPANSPPNSVVFYETFDNLSSIHDNGGEFNPTYSSFEPGIIGDSLHTMSGEYVTYDLTDNLTVGTIEFLFKSYDNGMGLVELRGVNTDESSLNYVMSFINSDLFLEVRYGGQSRVSGGVSQGIWHHVAMVWECGEGQSGEFDIYLDGAKGARPSWYKCDDLIINPTYILKAGTSYHYGTGNSVFDELKVYNYARPYSEIEESYKDYFGLCTTNNDCGIDGFTGNTVCVDDDVYQNYTAYSCNNPGPDNSSCSTNETLQIVETCLNGCVSGLCNIPPVKNISTGPVQIVGRNLLVDGNDYTVKSIGYGPVPIGQNPEWGYDITVHSELRDRDFPYLREMNANTIRTWGKVGEVEFLDDAWNNGTDPIRVIMGYWMGSYDIDYTDEATRASIKSDFDNYVKAYKDHPAVLVWAIGNEENHFYAGGDNLKHEAYFSLLNQMAESAYEIEGASYHPVMAISLEFPNEMNTIGNAAGGADDASIPYIDMWGINHYPGSTFGNFFNTYQTKTSKPLIISEYGIDAFNNTDEEEYESTQAEWTINLWNEIDSSIAVGGSLMEYSDEWWKTYGGNVNVHDLGGYTTSSHPDGYANEEWWGMMRTVNNGSNPDEMEPRAVYHALKDAFLVGIIECNIADTNGDGAVNVIDYHELTSTFGMPNYCGPVDFNLDGTVNLQDFVIMRVNYGNTTGPCIKEERVCPVAAPVAIAAAPADKSGSKKGSSGGFRRPVAPKEEIKTEDNSSNDVEQTKNSSDSKKVIITEEPNIIPIEKIDFEKEPVKLVFKDNKEKLAWEKYTKQANKGNLYAKMRLVMLKNRITKRQVKTIRVLTDKHNKLIESE